MRISSLLELTRFLLSGRRAAEGSELCRRRYLKGIALVGRLRLRLLEFRFDFDSAGQPLQPWDFFVVSEVRWICFAALGERERYVSNLLCYEYVSF